MSKKNSKATKRRRREYDLNKEKADQEARAKEQAKKALSLASRGITKQEKKTKTFRLRKGVRVKGIIVKDAESKKKARKILQAAGVPLGMDIDGQTAAEAKAAQKKKLIKTPSGGLTLKATKVKKIRAVVKPLKKPEAKADAEGGQMDVDGK